MVDRRVGPVSEALPRAAVGVVLASVGWLSPKYCAVGMVFSNLVVIFNSMHGMNLPSPDMPSRQK